MLFSNYEGDLLKIPGMETDSDLIVLSFYNNPSRNNFGLDRNFLCNFFPLRSLKLPKNGAENGNTDQNAYMTLCIEPMNLRVKYRFKGSCLYNLFVPMFRLFY